MTFPRPLLPLLYSLAAWVLDRLGRRHSFHRRLGGLRGAVTRKQNKTMGSAGSSLDHEVPVLSVHTSVAESKEGASCGPIY